MLKDVIVENVLYDFRISSAFQLYQFAEQTTVKKMKSEYLIASYQVINTYVVSDCCLTPTQQFFNYIMDWDNAILFLE